MNETVTYRCTRPHLRAEISQVDHDLDARPLLAPLQRHQLEIRRNDIAAFLARHEVGKP